jgi:hypothetical protein
MTESASLWTRLQRLFFGPDPGSSGRAPAARAGERTPYEILLEGVEPVEAWSVCTVCMNVDRTASVHRARWRCSDCGSLGDQQQPITQYLDENSLDVLDQNLRQWGSVKGVRPAYKMLKSARFKCLMTLSRRRQSASAAT